MSEAVACRCYLKQAFLKVSHNSKENTHVEVSILMIAALLEKETLAQVFFYESYKVCFHKNFAKFLSF